jgi:hypothetical protein
MKDHRLFAAGLGFAFVAAWIGFSFGQAVLCLLGAAIFWVVAGIVEGDLDLGDLQGRLQGRGEAETPRRPTAPPPRRPRFKSRVR